MAGNFTFNMGGGGSKNSGVTNARTGAPITSDITVQTPTGASAKKTSSGILDLALNAAEKLAPMAGPVGAIIGKGAGLIQRMRSNNDPEWWQNVSGTGVSTNTPLGLSRIDSTDADDPDIILNRIPLVEFVSCEDILTTDVDGSFSDALINPNDASISTYLMQNIRKVVNAIPLQSAAAYKQVLINNATAYALKHQLDKYIFLATNARPHMPALTDGSFEILAAANYATLVGLRDRLAEYCKASVRIPHTLSQYLAWRYGRAYRMNTSDKAGYVLYDVLSIERSVAAYQSLVNSILGFNAASNTYYKSVDEFTVVTPLEKQQANADLFNAYKDHVEDVRIDASTQLTYDTKEFVLRTNLDVGPSGAGLYTFNGLTEFAMYLTPRDECIYMDSHLDNKTTFMASTVSTSTSKDGVNNALFPVNNVLFFTTGAESRATYAVNVGGFEEIPLIRVDKAHEDAGNWFCVRPVLKFGSILNLDNDNNTTIDENIEAFQQYCVRAAALCKSVDLYNAEIYFPVIGTHLGPTSAMLDLTALATDLARCTADVIQNTQVYAFANLVTDAVKSYAAKESPEVIKASEDFVKNVVDVSTPASVHPK